MTSVSQVEEALKTVMEERACVLARQIGCIQRERAFNGADLLQTLVFGWLTHPDTHSHKRFAVSTGTTCKANTISRKTMTVFSVKVRFRTCRNGKSSLRHFSEKLNHPRSALGKAQRCLLTFSIKEARNSAAINTQWSDLQSPGFVDRFALPNTGQFTRYRWNKLDGKQFA
jgi:hypothetical protein